MNVFQCLLSVLTFFGMVAITSCVNNRYQLYLYARASLISRVSNKARKVSENKVKIFLETLPDILEYLK